MAEQVKVPCQAVAVRFVADPRTDEFLNVGVVLFCPARRYAAAKFLSSWARVSNAFPEADLVHLRRVKRLFEKACETWSASTQQPELFESVSTLDALLAKIGAATAYKLVTGAGDRALKLNEAINDIALYQAFTPAEVEAFRKSF